MRRQTKMRLLVLAVLVAVAIPLYNPVRRAVTDALDRRTLTIKLLTPADEAPPGGVAFTAQERTRLAQLRGDIVPRIINMHAKSWKACQLARLKSPATPDADNENKRIASWNAIITLVLEIDDGAADAYARKHLVSGEAFDDEIQSAVALPPTL